MNSSNCNDSLLFVDVEVRAAGPATRFNVTSQNYRFSISNRNAVRLEKSIPPQNIIQGSAIIPPFTFPVPLAFFYEPQNYNGSLDTVVSYNVAYAGPQEALKLVSTDWVPIGRLTFKLLNANECFDLIWHDKTPAMFPPTVMTEWVTETNNPEVGDNLYLQYSVCTNQICDIFPVELLSFDAELVGNDGLLSWVTASELNADYFEVYRSEDGQSFDHFVGRVEASGTTNTEAFYDLVDPNVAALQVPVVYYRLKQVDVDGTVNTFDDAVELRLSGNLNGIQLSVFPNPAKDKVNLEYVSNKDEFLQMQAYNAAGQIVMSQSLEVQSGINQIELNIENLAKGIYYINVFNEDYSETAKLMVE
jgi:hypothetical protein